jgi:hypothetical protein
MITGKLNLMNLKAQRKTLNGKLGPTECIVIGIDANNLFVGEKGIYLDLIAFDRKEKGKNGETHLIKQSFSKEEREAMTEDQRNSLPILGDLTIGTGGERASVSDMAPSAETDDLPF